MSGSIVEGKEFIGQFLSDLNAQQPIRRIVDIGCGRGTYSKLFRGLYPDAEWTGVEIFEPYIDKFGLKEQYDVLLVADAREVQLPGRYDVAICGDVLEHMTRLEALTLYNRLLTIATYVIVSIPTVPWEQGPSHGNSYETHVVPDWTHEQAMRLFRRIFKYRKGNAVSVYIGSLCWL